MADIRKSLLVIDMLNDYSEEDATFQISGFTNIIEPIKREIEEARKNNWPIIYLCDCHEKDDREFRLFLFNVVIGIGRDDAVTNRLQRHLCAFFLFEYPRFSSFAIGNVSYGAFMSDDVTVLIPYRS